MERTCRCPAHFGLAEYMSELTGRDYGLPPAPLAGQPHRPDPVTLRIQTLGPSARVHCDGTMTCGCENCIADRAARPALGAGRAQLKPRPPSRK